MLIATPPLHWLHPGEDFPSTDKCWGPGTDAPGLLAAGGALDVQTLVRAYSKGVFPWFSEGQPILWWSPNPRMVLRTSNLRLHRSFKKTLNQFRCDANGEIRVDSDFEQVIKACARSMRNGSRETWILPEMIDAYISLHKEGFAHSVETWFKGELVGGLYFVAIGKAVFGESMFMRTSNASKIALGALVCLCKKNTIELIDCQQNTAHLSSLGASEIDRDRFLTSIQPGIHADGPDWDFKPLYWREILD